MSDTFIRGDNGAELGQIVKNYYANKHVTDKELEYAIPRLDLLCSTLLQCGERFYLAAEEFARVHQALKGYQTARTPRAGL